ncbi:MAG: 3-hydroxyacyl-CoA dehydrogenase NAD-binding domain-containing protein [Planctomycetota bacterium]
MTKTETRPETEAPAVATLPVTIDDQGIAVLRLGQPDETVVTFTKERLQALDRALQDLAQQARLRGLVITGPGKGMFCAGADINLIHAIRTVAEGQEAAVTGRSIFQRCRDLPVPVVAAIEGPCVGGGCELALFCDLRIASDHPATQVGLPETKLGIVPGFGGTQNMARLLGLPTALDLILNGKLLRAVPAKKKGLVDRVVPSAKLLELAIDECRRLVQQGKKGPTRRLRGAARWLSTTPLRALATNAAQKALSKGQARFYPAPKAALDLCVQAFTLPADQGFAAEAKALGEMIATPVSKALTHLFFLTERSKRLGKADGARDLKSALVVGGGVMGAGIAGQLAHKGLRTRLCDLAGEALAKAKARLQQDLDRRLARKQLQRHEAMAVQDRLAVASDWGSLQHVDLWLEAVVEDLGVKRKLMAEAVARGLPADAILATNTSSLPVDAMADAVPNPERVVGIHFFNPPEKMPLVEVIRGPRTSDAAVATACRLSTRLGKFPIVVQDSPGFLVNRCLSPYLNEAARLLVEGNDPEFLDRVLLDFGMPMGPCRLLDEIGFDVATKVSEVMQQAFAERMQPCALFAAMVEHKALGKKAGGGLYDQKGEGRGPGRKVLEQVQKERRVAPRQASRSEVIQRLVYPLVDEAYRCLDDGVVAAEQDLDLGLVMGIGFPPFLGGITGYAESEGLRTIVGALDELARTIDPRFQPSDGLRRRALA